MRYAGRRSVEDAIEALAASGQERDMLATQYHELTQTSARYLATLRAVSEHAGLGLGGCTALEHCPHVV